MAKINRITHLAFGTIKQYLLNNLCVNEFKNCDVEVDILDVTPLLFAKTVEQDFSFVKPIKSFKELEDYIILHKSDTLFNVQMGFEVRFWRLFYLINKYGCKVSIFRTGQIPTGNNKDKFLKYLKNPVAFFKRIKEKIFCKILLTFGLVSLKKDVVFVSGNCSKESAKNITDSIIELNTGDYEENLKIKDRLVKDSYFVFLDEYMFKHQDYMFCNYLDKSYDASKYINDLNNFFDFMELKFGRSIVIAAHPKSNYDLNAFNGRKIIKGKTANLVKFSELVIMHDSTTVGLAAINYKPILFISSDDIRLYSCEQYFYTKLYADYMQMPFIDYEKNEVKSIPIVNFQVYNKYK
ncbi:hypothetical protein, partial [Campylobacter hyointestinalis]